MVDADRGFVVSAWSSSFRKSKWAGVISMASYAVVMHGQIEAILRRPSTRVIVAEEPGETVDGVRPYLYGFVAVRTDLPLPFVYYVYVKQQFRRARTRLDLEQGYATQLLAAAGVDPMRPFSYGFRTATGDVLTMDRWRDGEIVVPRKIPRASWDPLPARYEEPDEQRKDQQ